MLLLQAGHSHRSDSGKEEQIGECYEEHGRGRKDRETHAKR